MSGGMSANNTCCTWVPRAGAHRASACTRCSSCCFARSRSRDIRAEAASPSPTPRSNVSEAAAATSSSASTAATRSSPCKHRRHRNARERAWSSHKGSWAFVSHGGVMLHSKERWLRGEARIQVGMPCSKTHEPKHRGGQNSAGGHVCLGLRGKCVGGRRNRLERRLAASLSAAINPAKQTTQHCVTATKQQLRHAHHHVNNSVPLASLGPRGEVAPPPPRLLQAACSGVGAATLLSIPFRNTVLRLQTGAMPAKGGTETVGIA